MPRARLRAAIQSVLEDLRENVTATSCQLLDTEGFIIASTPTRTGIHGLAINSLRTYIANRDMVDELGLGDLSVGLIGSAKANLILKSIIVDDKEMVLCALLKKEVPAGLALSTIGRYAEKIGNLWSLSVTTPQTNILGSTGQRREEFIDRTEAAAEAQDVIRRLQQHPIYRSVIEGDPDES